MVFDGHQKEGIALLKGNIKNYPDSLWALNVLARAYDRLKQQDKSITYFNKALALAKQQKSAFVSYFESEIKRVKTAG
jgi:tetratricopeptide (TPR) repeat protein